MFELDETNQAPRKRKVAIWKSQGKIVEAIKELTDYLKMYTIITQIFPQNPHNFILNFSTSFMSDQEAWMELTDLYISQQEWNKAAFCVEELLLHNPNNHLYLQRYAEIKYTHVSNYHVNNSEYIKLNLH